MVQDNNPKATDPAAKEPAQEPLVKPLTPVEMGLARIDELKKQAEEKALEQAKKDREFIAVLPQAERDAILEKLTQDQKSEHGAMVANFRQVKQNNPDIDPEALDSYESMWLKSQRYINKERDDLVRDNKSEKANNPKYLKSLQDAQDKKWEVLARAQYGLRGELAFNAVDEINRPTGFVDGLTKNFYDKTDGGIQLGGIMGALGGIMLGMMGGAEMGGGWMSLLLIVGGALLGGMLGNKGGDMVSAMMYKEKTPSGPMAALQQEVEQKPLTKKPSKETVTIQETNRINDVRLEMQGKGASPEDVYEFMSRAVRKAAENPDVDVKKLRSDLEGIISREKAQEQAASEPLNLGTGEYKDMGEVKDSYNPPPAPGQKPPARHY